MKIISETPGLDEACSEIIRDLKKNSIKKSRSYKEIIVRQLTISKLNGEKEDAKAYKVLLHCVNKVLNEDV